LARNSSRKRRERSSTWWSCSSSRSTCCSTASGSGRSCGRSCRAANRSSRRLAAGSAVARYVGGQLLFSALLGTTTGLGLYIFGLLGIFPDGERFALAFGVFYALMELVPYIGPFLGAAPPVLVALFTEPLSALWVTLFFVAMQELEGHVVAPQIFGRTLRLNPLLVIFALLAGLDVGGLIGALVALPLLSIVRETVLYFERHLTFERWPRSPQSLL
jgi:predicted PurR-regulated permease PerM